MLPPGIAEQAVTRGHLGRAGAAPHEGAAGGTGHRAAVLPVRQAGAGADRGQAQRVRLHRVGKHGVQEGGSEGGWRCVHLEGSRAVPEGACRRSPVLGGLPPTGRDGVRVWQLQRGGVVLRGGAQVDQRNSRVLQAYAIMESRRAPKEDVNSRRVLARPHNMPN